MTDERYVGLVPRARCIIGISCLNREADGAQWRAKHTIETPSRIAHADFSFSVQLRRNATDASQSLRFFRRA
ncbi:MAG TPA: hypothetical protein VKX28_03215 [Xanthobacteraceae bacterium]|nr:hypothetical protein [Xanthobacteraceae bacterium]